ncbi:macro domain-containing protein [Clostridium estertheticum]|uniref:macro domain-containing protein n=1 Tax=Clostridium estertheticum TaxID=238834 RepID=UPI001C0B0371|nr:macro domain-containing protein [Clostridium estertheticum]MBU3171488.1 hypothetical protein [Clostridium estertheticum]
MKVNINDKGLLNKYFGYLSMISIPIGLISIFIDIPNKKKATVGLCFLAILVVAFFITLYYVNKIKMLNLKINNNNIKIKFGDLFQCEGIKVIPMNEYFDTSTENNLISEKSLHGEYLKKIGNNTILDDLLENKLSHEKFILNNDRTYGKKKRYKVGTTIESNEDFFLTAFTRFDEDDNARIKVWEYVMFFSKLWDELYKQYNLRDINIPLIGSGITRTDSNLNNQAYLELIMQSLKLSKININYKCNINIIIDNRLLNDINLFKIKNMYN